MGLEIKEVVARLLIDESVKKNDFKKYSSSSNALLRANITENFQKFSQREIEKVKLIY